MSFFDAINVAASGLTAERVQMDVTTENLANAQSTNNGTPYAPQAVQVQTVGSSNFSTELASALGGQQSPTPGGVEVTGIVNENVPDQEVYDPGNPQANGQGYVKEPDVQPVSEMTNLISESNAYQADVTAMSTAKSMYSSTLSVLK
jgi:flagellar basal-body rod protein FlgC